MLPHGRSQQLGAGAAEQEKAEQQHQAVPLSQPHGAASARGSGPPVLTCTIRVASLESVAALAVSPGC